MGFAVKRSMRALLLTSLLACMPMAAQASDIDLNEVERRISKLMDRDDMVGLSVAIVEDGHLIFAEGYGETLKGSKDKVTADTVFRWASVSKGLAATAVLMVAEDGHFGLGSPIRAHAPSLALPDAEYPVTVKDILTHQTGIGDYAYDTRLEDNKSARTIRSELKTLPRICKPGTCHNYQNVTFDAVAEMIETATGLPYKAVVNERLFEPLKMSSASLTWDGLTRSKSWARPHNRKGAPFRRVKKSYYKVPAAAGVNSSVKDLAKWMQAQMRAGETYFTEKTQNELHKPRVKTAKENRRMRRHYHALKDAHYGLGWRTYDYDGHTVVGHRGAVQGYRALVLFDPEKKTGIAALWNSSSSRPVGLQLEVMDQVYDLPKRDWMRLSDT